MHHPTMTETLPTPESSGTPGHGEAPSARTSMVRALAAGPEVGALVSALTVFVVFAIWADAFVSLDAIGSTLTVSAELGIVAGAVTLLMISGQFDLSVGSVLAITAVLIPYGVANWGLPIELSVIAAVAAAALIGLLNGLVTTRTGLPSFIVTLGALLFWRGIVNVLTEGFILDLPSRPAILEPFSFRIGETFNASVVWFLAITVVLALIASRTRFGNWIYATGGNEAAARSMGVPVKRVRVILFTLTASAAGLVGVIQLARFESAGADRGASLELEAIAAAVIGGTRLTGGYGSVIGTALGCLTVGMIRNGLALAGVASYWYTAIIGVLIIAAVGVNEGVRRLLAKAV